MKLTLVSEKNFTETLKFKNVLQQNLLNLLKIIGLMNLLETLKS